MAWNPVPLGGMRGVTQVKVARQNDMHAALGKGPHGAAGPANQVALRMVGGKIEGMMASDNPNKS